MSLGERLTAGAAGAVDALRPIIGLARPELGAVLDERSAAEDRLVRWGLAAPPGPRVWLHGASAGELLGASPVIDVLRERRRLSLAVTHFSRSGASVLPRLSADVSGLAPLDRPRANRRLMDALRPDLLVFAKLDVWPGLVGAARRAGVPTALINGTVRIGSGRLRWPARTLFRGAYEALDRVGAASPEDEERLLRLGVRVEALEVTGDATFDLARARAREARRPGGALEALVARLPSLPEDGVRLVAGSTWPADERALLTALGELPGTPEGRLAWQVVIAPHRPSESAVHRLLGECRAAGQPVARWSERDLVARLPGHGVVVFDEVGRLAELYGAGGLAYVGGGLGGTGLHNVLEPAAAGVAVLFGRAHDRGDATGLVAAGGGFEATGRELAGLLASFRDRAAREAAGTAAARYVEQGCGAAERSAALLDGLIARDV